MTESPDNYSELVQQKMQARAERHVLEQQAAQEAQDREAQAALTARSQAEQAEQARTEAHRLREVAAAARRNRPELAAQNKSNPIGLRFVSTLQDVCLRCGSENVRTRADNAPHILVCPECSLEWYVSPCWSCTTGLVDSRDLETPPCEQCGYPRCAVCGACNPQGCSTNPYTASRRQRDEAPA